MTYDEAVRVYSYILRVDAGYAPNPFHGRCTLACCKPVIRREASVGDWVLGITPKAQGNRVAYAMHVKEVLPFASYWRDPRFRDKRPRRARGASTVERRGDNCYRPLSGGRFRQLPSCHWDSEGERENPISKATDLGGEHVLIAEEFCYYGAEAVALPRNLRFAIPGRAHLVNFSDARKEKLIEFLESLPRGRHGLPAVWPVEEAPRPGPRCV